MKILIITDAWSPQVNGVVTTYKNLINSLTLKGHEVDVVHPYLPEFKRNSLRFYPEIEYVKNIFQIKKTLAKKIDKNTLVHIATEGPLGLFSKFFCKRNNISYTTCFHSLFPEFIEKRWGIPSFISYFYFRWFHNNSRKILVPTKEIKRHLENKKFKKNKISVWTRGVDFTLFSPKMRKNNTEKYILCVSRVSKEKGLDDFCQLNYPKKILVGDGPYLSELKQKYPDVIYLGKKIGKELSEIYANAEVFVFPSKSDTFGVVILESIASGTPVAAYPEPGPIEVIENNINGCVHNNLQEALKFAEKCERNFVYESSRKWTWDNSANQFINSIETFKKIV